MNHDPTRRAELDGPETRRGRLDRLYELVRRYRDQETCVLGTLEESRRELERAMREGWMCCVSGQVLPPGLQDRCASLQGAVEALERELVRVRVEARGVDDEIAALARRDSA